MSNEIKASSLPNLSEPRAGKSKTNPEGVGVFFAVMRTALSQANWKREDFDLVKYAEGQLNALEVYYENEYVKKTIKKALNVKPQGEDPAPKPTAIKPEEIPATAPTPEAPAAAPSLEPETPAEQEKKN